LLTATNLGRDITARIRGNSGQIAQYNVEELGTSASQTAPNCHVKSCSPAQLAQFDLAQLGDQLQGTAERFWVDGEELNVGGMRDARACIRSSGSLLTVIVSWSSRDIGAKSETAKCGGATEQSADAGSFTQNYVITSHIGLAP